MLLLAEYLPPQNPGDPEKRHIVSVFKLVQDLLAPSQVKGKNGFQVLMDSLPETHKARWFAGAALNSAEQAMASVMSTVLSRLNAFLDSELEQIICFDSAIDAETFASQKSAIFLVLPEEDQTKNFMAGLMIQNLSRELFSVADENGGKLKNTAVATALDNELFRISPAFLDEIFSSGDEVVEHVELVHLGSGLMPFLAVFATTAQIGFSIDTAVLEPQHAVGRETGVERNIEASVAVEINGIVTVTLESLAVSQRHWYLGTVSRGIEHLLGNVVIRIEAVDFGSHVDFRCIVVNIVSEDCGWQSHGACTVEYIARLIAG